MAQETAKKRRIRNTAAPRVSLYIFLAAIPIALLAVLYFLQDNRELMDWIARHIAQPYMNGAAAVTSFGPLEQFSVMEVLLTILILWALFFLIKTIVIVVRGPSRLYSLLSRLFALALVGLYIGSAFALLWGAGYRSTTLAEKTGLQSPGVTTAQLEAVTQMFADKANEYAGKVERDAGGHFNADTSYMLAQSTGVYTNIEKTFPALSGPAHRPKPMIYSKLMSLTGFTGVYVALTGEANVNVDAPGCLLPATIAHEMAHQRGVHAEQEANFAGIAACMTSNIPTYQYSGYLSGLIYLSDALYKADADAASRILSGLNDDVLTDWRDNHDYWAQYDTTAAEVVAAVYDSYLVANGEELGINSYNACVDMLVTWLGPQVTSSDASPDPATETTPDASPDAAPSTQPETTPDASPSTTTQAVRPDVS